MCMNCGCGRPDDRREDAANITLQDLARAADANGQSIRQSVDHIVATLTTHERQAGASSGKGLDHPAGRAPAPAAPHGSPESES